MRKSFIICLSGFAAALLFFSGSFPLKADGLNSVSASDSELVSAKASGNLYISIYGNRYAQVEETRRVHLNAGANRVLLDGIATHYRADSLRILDAKLNKSNVLQPNIAPQRLASPGKSFTYLSASYQPANLNAEKLLQASIGKEISVSQNGRSLSGELLAVNGSSVIIKSADGKTNVVPAESVSVSGLPAGLSNTASLIVECWADLEGDFDINYIYETDGITWTAKHSLIFNDEKSVVENWESTVAIENNSGTTFRNAVVSLLPGKVSNEAGEARMYAAAASAAPSGAARDAAVTSVGDQTSYTLSGQTTLVDGQSRQVPLFVATNVAVKREYFIPANSSGYYRAGKQEVSIRLEVDNCLNNKLGKPIPAGLVKIYQRSQDSATQSGPVQLVGSAQIGAKAVDEVFQMVIGTASDIKWDRVLIDRQPATAPGAPAPSPTKTIRPLPSQDEVWEEHGYKISVYNFKRDRAVEVTVELNYPVDQTIAKPWQFKEEIGQANTKLSVPKSDKAEVKYTIKERVR